MEQELAVIQQHGGELQLSRPAETVLKEAEMVAGPWGKKVEQLALYKVIGPSKHLYIEAWQMLGAMYRVTARVKSTNYVQFGDVHGFEAVAEAYHMPTGQVISSAEAMCLSDEENWGPRTKYEKQQDGKRVAVGFVGTPLQQIRSMAQTRACSKVLSNLFKWVARLKGYQGTPAEEMTGDEHDGDKPPIQQPQRKSQQPAAGNGFVSEPQAKRFWAIATNSGKSKEQILAFLLEHDIQSTAEIPRAKYDHICEAVAVKGEANGPSN